MKESMRRNYVNVVREPIGVAAASAILNVTSVTVQRLIRDGELAATKMPGQTGAYVMEREAVERLAEERAERRRVEVEARRVARAARAAKKAGA